MELLEPLVGRKVTVFSAQGDVEKQDVGMLEAAQGNWLRLKKSEETFFINIARVRLVKPFEPL
ncbi:hypothetical protein EON81_09205 [bacterium]|nr:MAG: hypothetical protein EON81_09205 [bacterium]